MKDFLKGAVLLIGAFWLQQTELKHRMALTSYDFAMKLRMIERNAQIERYLKGLGEKPDLTPLPSFDQWRREMENR